MRVPTSSNPLQVLGELALSDSRKAETQADSLDAQFQPVSDLSELAVTKKIMQMNMPPPPSEFN
jgi:hypothetical protein